MRLFGGSCVRDMMVIFAVAPEKREVVMHSHCRAETIKITNGAFLLGVELYK